MIRNWKNPVYLDTPQQSSLEKSIWNGKIVQEGTQCTVSGMCSHDQRLEKETEPLCKTWSALGCIYQVLYEKKNYNKFLCEMPKTRGISDLRNMLESEIQSYA